MDDEKDKTYEPGMDLDVEEEDDEEYGEGEDDDDDDEEDDTDEEGSDGVLEEDDDQFIEEMSENEDGEAANEITTVKDGKDKEIANQSVSKSVSSTSKAPKRFSFRVRKDKSSVEGGMFKIPFSKDSKEDVKMKKVKSERPNEQQLTLSTPSKFNPKTLKSIATDVQRNSTTNIITPKKFTKAKFSKRKRRLESPGNQVRKQLFAELSEKGEKSKEQEKERCIEEQKRRYTINFDHSVKVDKELTILAKVLNGEEILLMSRQSVGYPEFFTVLPMFVAIGLMEKLTSVLKTDLTILHLSNAPVEVDLGGGYWLALTAEVSKRSNNLYRSLRLESPKDNVPRKSIFYMNYASIYELQKGLKAVIREKRNLL